MVRDVTSDVVSNSRSEMGIGAVGQAEGRRGPWHEGTGPRHEGTVRSQARHPKPESPPPPPGVCLKGRALLGPTQSGYKAVGAHCKIGWGAVTGGWKSGWVVLGLRTCHRVEL